MQQKAVERKPRMQTMKELAAEIGWVVLYFMFWQLGIAVKDTLPENKRKYLMKLVFGGCVNLGVGVLIVVFARFYHNDWIFCGLFGTAAIHLALGGLVAMKT